MADKSFGDGDLAPAGDLGKIKLSSGLVRNNGFCTFCDHGPARPEPDIVLAIEGKRQRIVICCDCFKSVISQWNEL